MLNRLHKLREERAAKGEQGFTLIELLVVVVIIGILIAIAIPVYLNYKKGANDKSAQSDLRGAVAVMEQCNTDNTGYPTGVTSAGAITGCAAITSVSKTTNTTFTYFPSGVVNYIMEASNSGGSGNVYCYSSAAGGSVAKAGSSTLVTGYQVACP